MKLLFSCLFAGAALLGGLPLRADAVDSARALLKAHQDDAAIKLLQQAIAKDPAAVPPNRLLAEVLLDAERFDEADQAINAAVKANPNSAELHVVRGDLVFREGIPFEAEEEYRAAYKLDPKNVSALHGIARVWRMAGMRAKAATLIRQAHAIDPSDPEIESDFYALEGYSPANTERWEKRLRDIDKDSDLAHDLTRRVAIAKALNGKHEFEVAGQGSSYQIPLGFLINGKRIYGIGINIAAGSAKSQLQLDTGAGGIILSSKFAEKAGIERIADDEIGGLGNQAGKKAWVGLAKSLQFGNLEFRNCIVRVVERGSAVDAGGLVGTDIFRRFLVKLDLTNRRIDLSPLPGQPWDGVQLVDRQITPDMKGFAQMLNIGHFLLLPGKVSDQKNTDPTPGLFLVDTGSNATLLSTNVAPDVTKMHDAAYGGVHGLNGRVKKVYTADKAVLQFAGFRQTNLDVTAVDLSGASRHAGAEISVILGLPILGLFRSITFDYREDIVKFDYQP